MERHFASYLDLTPDSAMDSQAFESRRGVRYLGQYKPIAAYPLADGLVILPAGWDMFPYGPGGQMHLNISYLVGPNELSDSALAKIYRKWLIFDAFVLHDHFPIYHFDDNKVGNIEVVPAGLPTMATSPDYKQIDYGAIGHLVLMAKPTEAGLPVLSYSELFGIYQGLPSELKEMIEWSVSLPFRSFTRPDAFFNTNYWQLFHATILLERLIGIPPACPESFGTCTICGFTPSPHYTVRRRDWLRQVLTGCIDSAEVVEEYARVIGMGFLVRNKIAHVPLFDRSAIPDFPLGEMQTYGIERAVTEYDHDNVALQSLLILLGDIARYLLLDRAFGTKYFPRLRPLNAVRVSGGDPSNGKS